LFLSGGFATAFSFSVCSSSTTTFFFLLSPYAVFLPLLFSFSVCGGSATAPFIHHSENAKANEKHA
jgi:hypothetical protein